MKHEATDTSPEADDVLRRLYRARPGEARMRMASEMFAAARCLVTASLPEAVASDPVECRAALLRRFYGRDLAPATVGRSSRGLAPIDAAVMDPREFPVAMFTGAIEAIPAALLAMRLAF